MNGRPPLFALHKIFAGMPWEGQPGPWSRASNLGHSSYLFEAA
jgi:hypothetical protein